MVGRPTRYEVLLTEGAEQDLEAIHRCADRIVEKINKRILKQ